MQIPKKGEVRSKWYEIKVNPLSWGKWVLGDEETKDTDGNLLKPEILRFNLKFFSGADLDDINEVLYSTNTTMRRKAGKLQTTTEPLKYKQLIKKKLLTGVLDWEGIEEDGLKIPVSEDAFDRLPGWVTEKLLEEINEMNSLGIELEGE